MADNHVSIMISIWLSLLVMFMCIDLSSAQGKSIPIFQNITALRNRYLSESIGIGEYIGTIVAVDPDNTPIKYYIESDGGEYFSMNPTNGSLTLKKNLDYESQIEIKSRLVAIDADGQRAVIECTSFVNDVNDNPPVFNEEAIFRTVPEDAPIGYTVTAISVTDIDTANKAITVTCDITNPSFTDACTTFTLNVLSTSNTYWRGYLVLNKALDYETRPSYSIRLIAHDGDPSHDVINDVHVEIGDVNDSPPIWDYAGPKSIPEEEPVGTFILRVSATDGDATNRRPIYYELCGNNTELFQINSSTGVISNAMRLDYDNTTHEKGVPYDICVMAREIINTTSGQPASDSRSTATISLKITVLDTNDNAPAFSEKTYTASVYENTVSGANIPGLQMTVTDIDSGTFNSFDLMILNNTDVFGILPAKDKASSSATLYVKNGTKLDYEKGPRQYIIEVRAVQNFQDLDSQILTGSTTVIINVLDVNDITPNFDQTSYSATVSETAASGTLVIDINAEDPEEGNFGTAGIRYKLYGDNVPPNFQINENTGVVTVAPCSTPGQSPCIDYERKKDYTLTVSATDNSGLPGSRTRSVQLFVNVTDDNDNPPKMETSYKEYINEDQTQPINPLYIRPSDPDTVGGPLSFTISGDSSLLWKITSMTDNTTGRLYGVITAIRPIKYIDAKYPPPEFSFAVIVADQRYSSYANVTIIAIDINDNSPVFIPSQYDAAIRETTKGVVFVKRVTASDADAPTTGNGVIDIYIQSGAQGKFTVENVTLDENGKVYTADIYTTKDATFNYETQSSYKLLLIARDRGSPQSLSGNAVLFISVIDENNKDPSIKPSFQSVNVYENEPVGASVYQVSASDPDVDSKLVFYMTAAQATDGSGADVNSSVYDYTKLFSIQSSTGNVIVNSPLDRDKATRITYNLVVNDINANPIQTGNGSFLIHILEYNDKAPYFVLPYYNITVDEALNNDTFVLNINCRDADNKIAGYILKQIVPTSPPNPLYFGLLQDSGSLVVRFPVDFETDEIVILTVQCTDSGQPPLSNTTTVTINIRNINDNYPVFLQNQYLVNVSENTAGVPLINVSATDKDKGDYGVVRYSLMDTSGYFTIDNITGQISILPNARLDREKESFIKFQAVAYDSPMDANVRKSSVVPVYVTILDINDNCPMFNEASYDVIVPESLTTGSTIADLIVSDADEGLNGVIFTSVKNGSDNSTAESLFGIIGDKDLRHVYTKDSLKGKMGIYRIVITATDMNGSAAGCTNETTVTIEVQTSDNNAPQWIRPANPNTVIHVLESQYKGMFVYSSRAEDSDLGANGKIDYYFSITGNVLVSNTSGFKINIVSGVISAEVEFDREQQDIYYLNLVARDNARPPASSETTITAVILDVNDNIPKFPMKDGAVDPKKLPPLNENTIIPASGRLLLGSCNATDADSAAQNNRIYYRLVASSNKASDYIFVENTTCNIYLIKKVSYATTPVLEFQILAYNEEYDDSVKRVKREVNPSILPVILRIQDSNDSPPSFVDPNYLACVSVDAPFQQNIVQVSAADKDTGNNDQITYYLDDTMAFQIDKRLGIISNIISFHESSNGQTTYRFRAFATDGNSNASTTVTIFVTSSSNTAWLKVNKPVNDVLPFKQQIIKNLVDSSNGNIQFVCINDVKNYVNDENQESMAASNVLVSAFKNVDGSYVPVSTADLVAYVNTLKQQNAEALNSIYVTGAKEEEDTDSSILQEDAVLAVFIICILLIFLALLLLCIACLCIRRSNKKKKRNIQAASHTVGPVKPLQEMEASENPVYTIKGSGTIEGDVYSTVNKVRPHGPPIQPEFVVPTHSNWEPENFVPIEPPRTYLDEPEEPDEPVFVAYIDPDPQVKDYPESRPQVKHYTQQDPVIVAYLDHEPERDIHPAHAPVLSRHIEPEPGESPNNHDYDHHVSFPEEDEMDASIRDSPAPSQPSSYRGSPPPSPRPNSRRVYTESDSD